MGQYRCTTKTLEKISLYFINNVDNIAVRISTYDFLQSGLNGIPLKIVDE